jgi:hypothetical protein
MEVRGPQITNISSTTASVMIHCSEEMMLNLRCWSEDDREHRDSNAAHQHHLFNLRELTAGTRYSYQISSETYDSGELYFETPPLFEETVSFCAYGHTRRQEIVESTHRAIIVQMLSHKPQFIIHTGNMLGGGPRDNPSIFARDWSLNFFTPLNPVLKQIPFYLCPGQHDIDFINGDQGVQQVFPFLTGRSLYVIERGPMAMVVITVPHRLSEWRQQAEIIEQAFQQISFARWRFVCMHVPPHAAGMRGWIKEHSQGLWELMQRYRIDVVISGRQQQYQRLHPLRLAEDDQHAITVLTTSLGMEKLRDNDPLLLAFNDSQAHYVHVSCSADAIQIQARSQDGAVLDHAAIERQHYDHLLRSSKILNINN